MRSSSLPFLALLLYSLQLCCCGNSLSIFHPNETVISIHPDTNMENENSNESITLADLNEDCLYLIFNWFDLFDLLNVVQVNSKLTHLASDVFRRKYSNYEIQIEDTRRDLIKKEHKVHESADRITVYDFEIASNMMIYFGNQIHKLKVWNHLNRNYTSGSDWAMINRRVNDYGSESLIDLKLEFPTKALWPLFSAPFNSIQKLDITISTDISGIKLKEICPNVEELNIKLMKEVNYDFIDCELPHLQYLHLHFFGGDIWNRKQQIIGTIKKNPQIRSFKLIQTPSELAKVISKIFPYLDHLTLTFSDKIYTPINFKHVKQLVLHEVANFDPTNLSFSHLESFETSYFSNKFDKLTNFFRSNSNLSQLILNHIWDPALDLKKLTSDLPNLMEMIVMYFNEISIDNVIGIIEYHPKLMKFQFPVGSIAEADRKILRERFESDWHIKEFIVNERKAFLFERRIQV